MKQFELFIGDEYVGYITCDRYRRENGNPVRHIFRQDGYITIVREKCNLNIKEKLEEK